MFPHSSRPDASPAFKITRCVAAANSSACGVWPLSPGFRVNWCIRSLYCVTFTPGVYVVLRPVATPYDSASEHRRIVVRACFSSAIPWCAGRRAFLCVVLVCAWFCTRFLGACTEYCRRDGVRSVQYTLKRYTFIPGVLRSSVECHRFRFRPIA